MTGNQDNSSCYQFCKDAHRLVFERHCQLSKLSVINEAKLLVGYFPKNNVTTLTIELVKVSFMDSNAEAMLYQIASYFSNADHANFSLVLDGDSDVQNRLLKNILAINPHTQVSFDL